MARKPAIKQFAFAAGEISPKLFGRTDLERYRQSLQGCRNFIIEPTGCATNRPGTSLVRETKTSSKKSRLIPFTALNGQAYAIEFGDLYIRFHTLGGTVLQQSQEGGIHDGGDDQAILTDSDKELVVDYWIGATITNVTKDETATVTDNDATTVTHGGGITDWDDDDVWTMELPSPAVYEVVSPFTEDDLDEIDYAQQNDVMFLVHPRVQPYTLTRLADYNWLLNPYSVIKGVQPPTTVAFEQGPGTADATHPIKEWDWVVTAVDANHQESVPSAPLQETDAVLYGDMAEIIIQWAAPTAGNAPVSYNVYRGRNGVYGFIGSSTEIRFVDKNIAPDFSDGPPEERDPSTETITVEGSGVEREAAFAGATLNAVNDTETATKTEAAEAFDDFYLTLLQVTLPWLTSISYTVDYRPSAGGWTVIATNTVENLDFPIGTQSYGIGHNGLLDGLVASAEFRVTITAVNSSHWGTPSVECDKTKWTETSLDEAFISSFPSSVAFYEQRLVFGNYRHNGQLVRLSRTGDYYSFDQSEPLKEDDSFDLVLASSRLDQIRQLVPMQALIMLTAGAEWTAAGAEGAPLTPTSFDLKPKTAYGANGQLKAQGIGQAILFATERGRRIREFLPDPFGSQDRSRDLSIMAEHLFRDSTAIALQYADVPYQVAWVLRSDGVLLGLTYVAEQNIWAWHRHDTGGLRSDGAPRDKFESICSVPEENETSLYVIVNRTIDGATKRFVELFSSRRFIDSEDAIFVDSAITSDNRNTDATQGVRVLLISMAHSGGTHATVLTAAAGENWATDEWAGYTLVNVTDGSTGTVISNTANTVTVDALTGGTSDDFEAADVCNFTPQWLAGEKMFLDGDGTTFVSGDVGTQFEIRTQTVATERDATTNKYTVTDYVTRFLVTRFISTTSMVVEAITAPPSQIYSPPPLTFFVDWGQCFNTFSGLDHLEGESLAVLVDGNTHQEVVVSSGDITLDSGVFAERLQIGLPIRSELVTMPLDLKDDEGSVRLSKKIISAVGAEVDDYRGMWIGHKTTNLREAQERMVEDGYDTISPENKVVVVRPASGWSRSVNVVIQQRDPLPLTVLSVISEVKVGGNV